MLQVVCNDMYSPFQLSIHIAQRIPTLQQPTTSYGIEYASAFKSGNIYGVQFHPEKNKYKPVLF
jgi:imidazoleglycerol phosphate synthase glutamine amidotransferase subunit HisH